MKRKMACPVNHPEPGIGEGIGIHAAGCFRLKIASPMDDEDRGLDVLQKGPVVVLQSHAHVESMHHPASTLSRLRGELRINATEIESKFVIQRA